MKIALVASHVPSTAQPAAPQDAGPHCSDPHCGDQAALALGLGRALAAQGHRVLIEAHGPSQRGSAAGLPETVTLGRRVTLRYFSAEPAGQVPAASLPSHLGAFAQRLTGYWAKTKPDIVHAIGWTSALAALTAARDLQVPVVVSFGSLAAAERRSGITSPQQGPRMRMEACLAKAAARVIASSAQEVEDLTRLGISGRKVSLIPAGVDTAVYSQDGRAAKRGELRRLLHVGTLADEQRLAVLVRALTELPGTELVIAGGPAPADVDSDVVAKRLGKLAAGLGVADRVTVTGHVSDDDLPALFRSADLLVSAARHDPVGRAVTGAMACGVPVVATSVGATADAVIDGTTGLLLPPGRPEILARRVRDLLASPLKLSAYGIASADRARSRFPWQRIAAETVAAYRRCLPAQDEPDARQEDGSGGQAAPCGQRAKAPAQPIAARRAA